MIFFNAVLIGSLFLLGCKQSEISSVQVTSLIQDDEKWFEFIDSSVVAQSGIRKDSFELGYIYFDAVDKNLLVELIWNDVGVGPKDGGQISKRLVNDQWLAQYKSWAGDLPINVHGVLIYRKWFLESRNIAVVYSLSDSPLLLMWDDFD